MNHIVVQPYGKGLSTVKILSGDVELNKPFHSWALNSGKRLIFAHNLMHRRLKSHYVMGTFEQGAIYAYSPEETFNILTSAIGPDDEAVYRSLTSEDAPKKSSIDKSYIAWFTLAKFCELIIIVGWGIVKVVAFLLVIPFLISWLNKHK